MILNSSLMFCCYFIYLYIYIWNNNIIFDRKMNSKELCVIKKLDKTHIGCKKTFETSDLWIKSKTVRKQWKCRFSSFFIPFLPRLKLDFLLLFLFMRHWNKNLNLIFTDFKYQFINMTNGWRKMLCFPLPTFIFLSRILWFIETTIENSSRFNQLKIWKERKISK